MIDTSTDNTIIAGLSTIIVALISVIAARGRIRRPNLRPIKKPPVVDVSPLAAFSGTQDKFVQQVIDFGAGVQKELREVKADREADKKRLIELTGEVETIRQELFDSQAHHATFERAIKRYLNKISVYIDSLGGEMPAPDREDEEILVHTLPRGRRHTT